MADEIEKRRRVRASDDDRDAVLEVLRSAHASGRLDPEEVDERQTSALSAKFLDELPDLIDDLPEGQQLNAQLLAMTGDAASQAVLPRPRPSGLARGENVNRVAVMSSSTVVVAQGTPKVSTYNFWGGDTLDLREALGPGVSVTVESYSVMAGLDIIVPEGTRVDDKTVNVMAGNDVHGGPTDGTEGTLVLTGVSVMAGHDIHVRKR